MGWHGWDLVSILESDYAKSRAGISGRPIFCKAHVNEDLQNWRAMSKAVSVEAAAGLLVSAECQQCPISTE
jgi:hypothetical protein